MARYGLSVNLPKMKADLERYHIHYDEWFYESSLHNSGYVADTVDALAKLGFTYEKDGVKETLSCDTVYYAVGMRSRDGLFEELAPLGIRLSMAGDCKKPGKVAGAVHSGYFAAMDIGKF